MYLLDFLKIFCSHDVVQNTLMTLDNIAMIFTPCLLRCPAKWDAFEMQPLEFRFVRALLLAVTESN
jgi:hypothetical protein